MRVEQLGEGTPEVAVVGSIHGDEPCGARAVERLLADPPDLDRPVKFIIANERALTENVRYVDEDLNRAFPGNPDADTHEGRLAHELSQELRDCTIFSMHSTQSYAAPFALVDELSPLAASVVPYLTVEALIETMKFSEGRLIESQDVIEVECGIQGSERAAANAYTLTREFLGAVGAIEAPTAPREDIPVFRMDRILPKPPAEEYETFVANFERVAEGEAYARAGEQEFVADRPFYPILLSPYGYETEFGYTGDLVGRLDEQATPGPEPTPER